MYRLVSGFFWSGGKDVDDKDDDEDDSGDDIFGDDDNGLGFEEI